MCCAVACMGAWAEAVLALGLPLFGITTYNLSHSPPSGTSSSFIGHRMGRSEVGAAARAALRIAYLHDRRG